MTDFLVIFADVVHPIIDPTWTDKEVLIAVGSTVAALIPVVTFVVRYFIGVYRDRALKAENELEKLRNQVFCLSRNWKNAPLGLA
jgi:hypothetical protein